MGDIEPERKKRILQATIECISEIGIYRATLRTIARRAGVSVGMLQYYYPTKKDLLIATHQAAVSRLRDRANLRAQPSHGLERLRTAFTSLHQAQEEGAIPSWSFWIWYWAEATLDPDLRAQHQAQLHITREILAESIKSAISSGELRPDIDPLLVADMTYSLNHGLGMEAMIAPDTISQARISQIASFVLSFLNAPTDDRVGNDKEPSP